MVGRWALVVLVIMLGRHGATAPGPMLVERWVLVVLVILLGLRHGATAPGRHGAMVPAPLPLVAGVAVFLEVFRVLPVAGSAILAGCPPVHWVKEWD